RRGRDRRKAQPPWHPRRGACLAPRSGTARTARPDHRGLDGSEYRRRPRGSCDGAKGGAGMNRQGRPTQPIEALSTAPNTFTGNRALRIEEALIFETGRPEVTGVDLDEPANFKARLGGLERKKIGLPGL